MNIIALIISSVDSVIMGLAIVKGGAVRLVVQHLSIECGA